MLLDMLHQYNVFQAQSESNRTEYVVACGISWYCNPMALLLASSAGMCSDMYSYGVKHFAPMFTLCMLCIRNMCCKSIL